VAEAGGGGGDVDDLARAGAEVGGEEGAGKGDAGAQEHIGVGPLRVVVGLRVGFVEVHGWVVSHRSPVPHPFRWGNYREPTVKPRLESGSWNHGNH
jgi:hypothetical protein